jgi:signal transduction histidine kinase
MEIGRMRAHTLNLAPWGTLLQALTAEPPGRSLDELLEHVATAAREIVGCAASLLTVVGNRGAPQVTVSAGGPPARLIDAGPLAEVITADRAVRLSADDEPGPLPGGARSLLGVPVRLGGRCVGGLYLVDRAGERSFSDLDTQLAGFVAATAAALVRRDRLAAAYEQRQRWLTESADLTRSLLAGEHADPLQLVVQSVSGIADADLVAVMTAVPDTPTFRVIAAAGEVAHEVLGRVIQSENTEAPDVIAEGVPRVLTRLSARPRRAELAEIVGAESAILVPLTGPGIEQGMLAVVRRPTKPSFSTAEIEATTMFAAQMTLALQFAENRARRERVALLDERDRIARDLHDHVIQRLFAIGLTMQNVGAQSSDADAKRLLAAVDDLDETIAQIRSTIYRLTTPILSADSSIKLRVGRLIDELEEVLGTRPELDVRGAVDLSVPDELTDDSVAVVREALTNVARHAAATWASVRITADPDQLQIEILDNGRGIGTASRRSGLANLRARAERRAGRLTISDRAPSGTHLTWAVPLASGHTIES